MSSRYMPRVLIAGNTLVNTSLPVFLDSVVRSSFASSSPAGVKRLPGGGEGVTLALADLRSVAAGLLFLAQQPLR